MSNFDDECGNVKSSCTGSNHNECSSDELSAGSNYTTTANYNPDSFKPHHIGEAKSNESLHVGNMIAYYNPLYVWDNSIGFCQAMILSIAPKKECLLVLDNGMILPRSTKAKRIKELVDGNLVDHPGTYCWICNFRMKKSGCATAADRMGIETARFGRVMDKNMAQLNRKVEADSFAPVDMLVNIKGAKSAAEEYKNPIIWP